MRKCVKSGHTEFYVVRSRWMDGQWSTSLNCGAHVLPLNRLFPRQKLWGWTLKLSSCPGRCGICSFFFQKGRGVNSILLLLENLQKDIFLSDLRYGIGQVRFQFKALQYILECLTIIKIAFKLQIC